MSPSDPVAQAAARLLALRPAASMEEVAAAAGISRATLFRRFPSRAALVAELSRQAVDAFASAVDIARPEDGDPVGAFGRLIDELARLAPSHGLLALQPLDDVVETGLLERAAAADARIRRLLHRGQEQGAFRVDVPADWVLQAVTWLVVAAADGLRLGRVAPADVARLLRETLLRGLQRR